MLLNWARNRTNGPRFLPSGKRFGPYFCSRLEASPASRPFSISVVRRLTTWSTAIVCQVTSSAVGLAFVLLIDLFRQAGSSLTATAHPATKAPRRCIDTAHDHSTNPRWLRHKALKGRHVHTL